jgi:hypothetical protein
VLEGLEKMGCVVLVVGRGARLWEERRGEERRGEGGLKETEARKKLGAKKG